MQDVPACREWLSPKEVSAITGINFKTLEAWRRMGKGPCSFKTGRLVKYPRKALDDWVRKNGNQ